MTEGLIEKAAVLMHQERYDEAGRLLGQLLSTNPNDDTVLYFLAEIELQKENYDNSEELINQAISVNPEESNYFQLKSRIYLGRGDSKKSEMYIKEAIGINPYEAHYFAIWAHIKLLQKEYETALDIANQALEIDSSHLFALNVRSTALLKLNRKDESFDTIAEALHENPNNAYTHSNYGWGLLEKGYNKKALQHFSEALKNNPNSPHAQAGMMEALKARFIIYRWFLKYAFWMSNMTSKYQWVFIIGLYIATRTLNRVADSNAALQPFIYPIVILLALFAFSTWIINPISNLFLRLNPYGRYLLSREEKISSTAIGACVFISLLSVLASVISGNPGFFVLAVFSFTMMIPLSNIFTKPAYIFYSYNIAMLILGTIAVINVFTSGILLNSISIFYFFGLLAFQFVANYYVTKS